MQYNFIILVKLWLIKGTSSKQFICDLSRNRALFSCFLYAFDVRGAHLRMRMKYQNYSWTFAAFSWCIQEETSFCNRKIKIKVELYYKQIVYTISPKEIRNYFTVINDLLLKLMHKIRVEVQSNLNFPFLSKLTLVVDLSS